MRISTWNVNGIRACYNNGGLIPYLKKYKPKILCLQEIKALEEQIPKEIIELKNYDWTFFPAKRKGYSGVATAIHKDVTTQKIIKGIGKDEFDDEGRGLIVITDTFILMSAYFPNGSRDHSRVPYKLSFYDAFMNKAKKLEKQYSLPVIMTGDFNTAHTEIDLSNPKTNQKTTGFLPQEREWVDKYLGKGFIDIYRQMYPKKQEYTWWSYRNNCRERNIGWRIDYFLVSQGFESHVKRVTHHVNALGSDHCPVMLELN